MIISSEGKRFDMKPYGREADLQKIIFDYPLLVCKNDGMDIPVLVKKREVVIEGAAEAGSGKIDCLLIDEKGAITIVETKLAKNGESRRVVVGQIFDYISALTNYNFDKLDQALDNELSGKMSEMDDEAGNNFRRAIDRNLAEGNARLVIALDESNEHLRRIVSFLSDNTDFELDLVEISCYLDGEKKIYSSNIVVDSANHEEKKDQKRHSFRNGVLDSLQEEWNTSYAGKYGFYAIGDNYTYRQVRRDNQEWPSAVHYEFTNLRRMGNFVEVRIDNELKHDSPIYKELLDVMKKYIGKTLECNGRVYELEAKKYSKMSELGGILRIKVELDNAESDACELMQKLIELTSDDVNGVVGR